MSKKQNGPVFEVRDVREGRDAYYEYTVKVNGEKVLSGWCANVQATGHNANGRRDALDDAKEAYEKHLEAKVSA